ncbi:MAG: hypothetical protein NTY30_03255 [Candidatus Berkelbacteria bacterium]|nr:hypothetical protein [Candidatus Berkelbacteria bacterium]
MSKTVRGKIIEGTGPNGEPLVAGIQMSGFMLEMTAMGYDGREAELIYMEPRGAEPENGILLQLKLLPEK